MTPKLRHLALCTAVLALVAIAPTAQARPRCASGTTMFLDGELRLFSTAFHSNEEGHEHGHLQYACLGTRMKPMLVGSDSVSDGVARGDNPLYAFAGGRYLLTASESESEGGPSAEYEVFDLRARRRTSWVDANFDLLLGPRVTFAANGWIVSADDGEIHEWRPGTSDERLRRLSTPGARATQVAIAASTAYWTEAGSAARSAKLSAPVPQAAADAHLLAPVATRSDTKCTRRTGTTVARSPRVRVLRRGGSVLACRLGDAHAVRLTHGTDPTTIQIAGDRWVSAAAKDRAFVVDVRERRTVTEIARPPASTIQPDGTLAWIDATGQVLSKTPAQGTPTVLQPAGGAPTLLASSKTTVYWTDGGAPHRFVTATPR